MYFVRQLRNNEKDLTLFCGVHDFSAANSTSRNKVYSE